MGKLIVFFIGITVLAIILAGVVVYFRRKAGQEKAKERGWSAKGDLNSTQERKLIDENKDAEYILRSLLAPPNNLGDDLTILSGEHKQQIEAWLRSHIIIRRAIGR